MLPTVFCINFTRAFSFLTQVQEQIRLGKLLMSLGTAPQGLLGAFCETHLRKAWVSVSCFPIPQIFQMKISLGSYKGSASTELIVLLKNLPAEILQGWKPSATTFAIKISHWYKLLHFYFYLLRFPICFNYFLSSPSLVFNSLLWISQSFNNWLCSSYLFICWFRYSCLGKEEALDVE